MILPHFLGPFYVGIENYAHRSDSARLTRAFMMQIDPPYRSGKAIRIRWGNNALHLGWASKPKKDIDAAEHGGKPLTYTPAEIRSWGLDVQEEAWGSVEDPAAAEEDVHP